MARHARRARRGDVRAAALVLLAEAPCNGYQLMQEIENRSGGAWRPSPGSMYPALARLERERLVYVVERSGQRAWALTDAGRGYVEERRDALGSPWQDVRRAIDGNVLALFEEFRRLAIATTQVGEVGRADQVLEAVNLLTSLRRALYSLLGEDDAGNSRVSP
jgi:DNA-binding PadR family transcriptional regulator